MNETIQPTKDKMEFIRGHICICGNSDCCNGSDCNCDRGKDKTVTGKYHKYPEEVKKDDLIRRLDELNRRLEKRKMIGARKNKPSAPGPMGGEEI